MVLLLFTNRHDYEQAIKVVRDKTPFNTKNGDILLFVPPFEALHLQYARLPFTEVDEKDLEHHLTAREFDRYKCTKEQEPQFLYKDVELPPLRHRRATIYIDPDREEEARRVIACFEPRDLCIQPAQVQTKSGNVHDRAKFTFYVPSCRLEDLQERLKETELATHHDDYALFLSRDPDFPQ
ncbi:hypothetical protein HY489_06790 [Candidatus Woesearchaeota archaeon]|nr:hypothetical protein [Candidatus Woesearchaeota archaeon]